VVSGMRCLSRCIDVACQNTRAILLIGNNHATSLFRGEGFNLPAEVSPYRQTWQDSFLASQLGMDEKIASPRAAARSRGFTNRPRDQHRPGPAAGASPLSMIS
jgi:hypothetical protein